jgi:AcrR family transcriptional regulator
VTTRDRILDAAAELMRTRGIVRTTTKAIAQAAGFSEATLYKHFRDKADIVLAVLAERQPTFVNVAASLPGRVGKVPVEETLTEVVAAALGFYGRSFPIFASLYGEPGVLVAHRKAMAERGAGPQHPVRAVTGYLAAEQEAGRISAGVDPEAVGALLLGACVLHAMLDSFAGRTLAEEEVDRLAREIVRPLLPGILTGAPDRTTRTGLPGTDR